MVVLVKHFADDGRREAADADENDVSRVVLRAPASDVTGAVTTRRCAIKDKRNLREKRRSTGLVSYSDTPDAQVRASACQHVCPSH